MTITIKLKTDTAAFGENLTERANEMTGK